MRTLPHVGVASALSALGLLLIVTVTTDSPAAARPAEWPRVVGIATGAHWGNPTDMPALKNAGYAFDVITVDPERPAQWRRALNAASATGLRLIIGGYPSPYSYSNGRWTISTAGRKLLDYLERRSALVLALFVFNEPYWISPFTGQTDACGATSAAQLRALRKKIRSVWPGAKIYHDLGWPAAWAPGGAIQRATPCVANKYADATGVADYVGIWDYPFKTTGYARSQALATLTREARYVTKAMHAIPVWLGQSFSGSVDLVWPTSAQLHDWNCSIRAALPANSLISWYVWRQDLYPDYLSNHPELWDLTTPAVCP